MPITPDEFRTNDFEAAFASALREHRGEAEDVPAYAAAHLGMDDMASLPGLPISSNAWDTPGDMQRQAIVSAFHKAVKAKNTELVQTMVQRGLVSPDVPDRSGTTPLCAAVRSENLLMAKLLLDLGADASLPARERAEYYALPRWRRRKYGITPPQNTRTPLMLTAAGGRLAMLRLLLDAGADDAAIAPDGQTALRLAADAGHRDVVDALPARRGGAWRRWRHHNERALHRAQVAAGAVRDAARFLVWELPKFLVWELPRFFLWTLPRWLAPRIGRLGKRAWGKLRSLGGVLGREIALLPARMAAAGRAALKAVMALPGAMARGGRAVARLMQCAAGAAWAAIKATPTFVAQHARRAALAAGRAARWCGRAMAAAPGVIWRGVKTTAQYTWWACGLLVPLAQYLLGMIKALPSALTTVWGWLRDSTTAIGRALAALLARPLALLHTAAMAVISAIRRARNVTPRDVWNAFTALLAAIADVPRQIWRALCTFSEMSFKVLEKVFGIVGCVVYGIVWLCVAAVLYVPKQLGVILLAAGRSVKNGAHEVAVWINPKF